MQGTRDSWWNERTRADKTKISRDLPKQGESDMLMPHTAIDDNFIGKRKPFFLHVKGRLGDEACAMCMCVDEGGIHGL